MLRWVLLIVAAGAVSATQSAKIPITQTLDMLRSANDVFTRVSRFGGLGGGLAIFLPVLLCIGFFAFIIPLVAILSLGTGAFSGGSQGWGGLAGSYPAGRNVDEVISGLPFTNDQLVQAMTFLDKAFSEFSSKLAPVPPLNKNSSKRKPSTVKFTDQIPSPTSEIFETSSLKPRDDKPTVEPT